MFLVGSGLKSSFSAQGGTQSEMRQAECFGEDPNGPFDLVYETHLLVACFRKPFGEFSITGLFVGRQWRCG